MILRPDQRQRLTALRAEAWRLHERLSVLEAEADRIVGLRSDWTDDWLFNAPTMTLDDLERHLTEEEARK